MLKENQPPPCQKKTTTTTNNKKQQKVSLLEDKEILFYLEYIVTVEFNNNRTVIT